MSMPHFVETHDGRAVQKEDSTNRGKKISWMIADGWKGPKSSEIVTLYSRLMLRTKNDTLRESREPVSRYIAG